MFAWANRKARIGAGSNDVVIRRLYYLSLGLIFDNDRSMSRERARACQVAVVRAEQFVEMLNSDLDLFRNRLMAFPLGLNEKRADNEALELDRAYDLPYEFRVTTIRADSLSPVDLELIRLQFITDLVTHSVAEGPRRAFAPHFADYCRRTHERYQLDFDEEIEKMLDQIGSPERSLLRQHIWVRSADRLRSALQKQRDIGHEWRLTTHHVELLSQVLQASSLIYDCLQVAAVDDRQSIAQSLLSPPDNN